MAPQDPRVHPDVLTLAELLRPEWPAARERIRLSGHPTCDGDDGAGDGAGEEEGAAGDGGDGTGEEEGAAGDGGENDGGGNEPDWKKMARRHEREKKAALKRENELKTRLDEIDAANLSEKEKEIAAARAEARTEALSEAEKERRADRLELAVTRIAISKGVTLGDGDKAKTVKFADPDDVQMWLERQIEKGDIDADDIYGNDGKVDTDVLTDALIELASSKPGWLAGAAAAGGAGAGAGRPAGDSDAGKGNRVKELEEMSVEDHVKRKARG